MQQRRFFLTATFGFLAFPSALLSAADVERVDFRLLKWKSLHFDAKATANQYLKTFKTIGCECKQEQHDGHIDVSFRCVKWRSVTAKSHADAHKWEEFLKKAGFETRHEH